MSTRENNPAGMLNQAMANRLARLHTMPVDTSRLDRALSAEIPRPSAGLSRRWSRVLRAVAALVLVAVGLAAILWLTSGETVLASTAQMVQVHEDMVANRIPVMRVDSIEEAGKILGGSAPDSPALPAAPDAHVMACCMKSIQNRKMACILLKSEGVPVTMTVANASDMQPPKLPTITRNGHHFHVQAIGKLNMVVSEQQGRWVCLMGEVSNDRLIDMASHLKF